MALLNTHIDEVQNERSPSLVSGKCKDGGVNQEVPLERLVDNLSLAVLLRHWEVTEAVSLNGQFLSVIKVLLEEFLDKSLETVLQHGH